MGTEETPIHWLQDCEALERIRFNIFGFEEVSTDPNWDPIKILRFLEQVNFESFEEEEIGT